MNEICILKPRLKGKVSGHLLGKVAANVIRSRGDVNLRVLLLVEPTVALEGAFDALAKLGMQWSFVVQELETCCYYNPHWLEQHV